MIVVPYEPWHLLSLDLRAYEEEFLADFQDLQAYADILMEGIAFTLWHERPIGCFGVLRFKPGVGEGWLCLSKSLPIGAPSRLWLQAATLIDGHLAIALKQFHRVQVAVPESFEQGQRFVRRLGFESEGVLRKYGSDGADFHSFSRVSECQ